MKRIVVIGAGFGDEGKGMTTHTLAERFKPKYVVRFNGGGQAGHTVVHNGVRHVFSHFNSATMLGCETIFAPEAIVNPFVVDHESKSLSNTVIWVHPDCSFTTLLDMYANRKIVEGQFSSCGLGINTTQRRVEGSGVKITIDDVSSIQTLFKKHKEISEWYISQGLTQTIQSEGEIYEMAERFQLVCFVSFDAVHPILRKLNFDPLKQDVLIFEGAQGLQLDQEFGEFPFVTPSYTGAKNALDFIGANAEIDVVYVTRTFATRHGDGPFDTKEPWIDSNFNYVDETNQPNQFQGTLRVGQFDVNTFVEFTQKDIQRNSHHAGVKYFSSISHLDFATNGIITTDGIWYEDDFISRLDTIYPVAVIGNGPATNQWQSFI